MSAYGHCVYYAQRGETYWCGLKKAALTEDDYHKHCSFEAETRCPLRQDLAFSELARRRSAVSRLTREGKGGAQG